MTKCMVNYIKFPSPNGHNSKLGTYLVLKKSWNPIDFQGHRSTGQIFETIQYALCHRKFSYMINTNISLSMWEEL
jgi:hypothetical protein